MRLRNDKIHDLAAQVLALIRAMPEVEFLVGEDAIRVAVGSVIRDDLEEEDDIDREVDELLQAHEREIDAEDMDVSQLRHKFKQQIARKRGFRY